MTDASSVPRTRSYDGIEERSLDRFVAVVGTDPAEFVREVTAASSAIRRDDGGTGLFADSTDGAVTAILDRLVDVYAEEIG